MPIYAYKCGSCGHAKDVLQKISDVQLTVCPACGASSFSKQVTAAGFQLKGSGWYATDFRSSGTAPAAAPATEAAKGTETAKPADSGSKPAETSTPAPKKTDAPSASAGSCGSACACH